MEKIIDQWFKDNFHNNKISQDTECYNIAQAAKEKLKILLLPKKEINQELLIEEETI